MAYLKVTRNHNLEHYDVIYECGCIRNAIHGTFNVLACKKDHDYKDGKLKLPCRCWDLYSDTRWCDNHYDLQKEAKLLCEICDTNNKVKYLESKLQVLRNRRN